MGVNARDGSAATPPWRGAGVRGGARAGRDGGFFLRPDNPTAEIGEGNSSPTGDVTWESTLDVGAPSKTQLPEVPEQGGAQVLEEAPERGGTEDFASDPTIPLPRLGRGIRHQLRVVSPMTQPSDDF